MWKQKREKKRKTPQKNTKSTRQSVTLPSGQTVMSMSTSTSFNSSSKIVKEAAPYHLLLLPKHQKRIIYYLVYFCLAFAIAYSAIELNFETVSFEQDAIEVSSPSKLKFFASKDFDMLDAYFELDGEFKLYDNVSLNDPIYQFFTQKDRDINLTVLLNVTQKMNNNEMKHIRVYEKNMLVSTLCSENKLSCQRWNIWSAYEDWSNDYPISWQYSIFPTDNTYLYFETIVFINGVGINDTILNGKSFREYGKLVFKYTKENATLKIIDNIIRGIACGLTGLFFIFWIYKLFKFRV